MDAAHFVGKMLSEVEDAFGIDGVRVMEEDGVSYMGTCDWKPTRLNVALQNGRIIRAWWG